MRVNKFNRGKQVIGTTKGGEERDGGTKRVSHFPSQRTEKRSLTAIAAANSSSLL